MTPEQERWAEALAVMRMHGAKAPEFAATESARFMLQGDGAGAARWDAISRRVAAILAAEAQPRN